MKKNWIGTLLLPGPEVELDAAVGFVSRVMHYKNKSFYAIEWYVRADGRSDHYWDEGTGYTNEDIEHWVSEEGWQAI